MIKVSLLGDSIRQIGYGKVVPQMLGDGYEVYQPAENCRFSKYTLRGLFEHEWGTHLKGSDVIHWNNGLWDICDLFGDGPFTKKEEYVETMLRIAKILKTYGKTVIFATITSMLKDNVHNKNAVIDEYNAAIVPELEKIGVIINDLNALVSSDKEKYLRSDDLIHLSDDGIEACGKQVAEIIKKYS